MKRINWNAVPWLIILIAVLIAVAFFAMRGCQRKKEKAADIATIIRIKHDTVHHWTDNQGRDHGQVRLAEADAASLRGIFPILDSVMRILRIKEKQLQSMTSVSVTTAGEVIPIHDTVRIGDSTYNRWSYSDKFLTLEGIATDPPVVHYRTFDSLTVTSYWKRKNIFSKKIIYVDAVSLNPNARIGGMTALKVAEERPKRLSAGPCVGFMYDGSQWKPSAGVAIQYSIIRK